MKRLFEGTIYSVMDNNQYLNLQSTRCSILGLDTDRKLLQGHAQSVESSVTPLFQNMVQLGKERAEGRVRPVSQQRALSSL